MNNNESESAQVKQKHIGAYIGLCAVSWIIGAILASSVSAIMGDIYIQASAIVIFGFWAGKALLKNKTRNWSSIVAFPVVNFISALTGPPLTQNFAPQTDGAVGIFIIAFILSCGLFAALPKVKE